MMIKGAKFFKTVALQTHSSTYSHSYLYYNAIVKYYNHICILDIVHLAHMGKAGCLMEWRKEEKLLWRDHYQLDCTPLPVPPAGEGKSRLLNGVRYLAQEDKNGPKFQ